MTKQKGQEPKPQPTAGVSSSREGRIAAEFANRHLRFGWLGLLLFLSLGLVLEALHGLKVDYYLNLSNETRRLMWTLAHTHGTLLSVVNIALALTLSARRSSFSSLKLASRSLMAATVLMPLGFFSGGVVIYAGDPGLGVFLVPIAGFLLFLSIALLAREFVSRPGL